MRNPFKLWGSYVGLIVGLVGGYFSFAFILDAAERGVFTGFYLLIPVAVLFAGFLVGWVVHEIVLRE